MPFTIATLNLLQPLALAFGDDLAQFCVTQKGDGVIHVTPTFDIEGIGGRIAEEGMLPSNAINDDLLVITQEAVHDPTWLCRYVGIHCRTRGGEQPLNVKIGAQWPMRYSDILVKLLRRCHRDLMASAEECRRKLAADPRSGLVDEVRSTS